MWPCQQCYYGNHAVPSTGYGGYGPGMWSGDSGPANGESGNILYNSEQLSNPSTHTVGFVGKAARETYCLAISDCWRLYMSTCCLGIIDASSRESRIRHNISQFSRPRTYKEREMSSTFTNNYCTNHKKMIYLHLSTCITITYLLFST